ncbi:tRNA adenosine(34) deaminase TadA [Brevundimonas variabilis]|uniref:tRNA-specific adenosine deaminase n=1 Tax=Brevundimonas variabilis TaxID=74312 RepID=A0A7W9CHA3_9CAUL|nr:tRNA adenosine(34) deaminase TadA [Brevundimonas variabilis]MBB5745620.1 tRNA(Arg) A34 adenosine deaminase TadA [Brevundimonas variabilis]
MRMAMALAQAAADAGEVPVGAVIVDETTGEVVGRGMNGPVAAHDPTAHAEIVALRDAGRALSNYRLTGLTLYVTLEPCAMCAGAISHARIGRVVWAADDPKGGAVIHGPRFFEQPTCHWKPDLAKGPCGEESGEALRAFFRSRRQPSIAVKIHDVGMG